MLGNWLLYFIFIIYSRSLLFKFSYLKILASWIDKINERGSENSKLAASAGKSTNIDRSLALLVGSAVAVAVHRHPHPSDFDWQRRFRGGAKHTRVRPGRLRAEYRPGFAGQLADGPLPRELLFIIPLMYAPTYSESESSGVGGVCQCR